MELKDQMNAADIILDRAPETYAYAATLVARKIASQKAGSAADQRGRSDERDVVRAHSTVFASATLAVDNKFDAFESALGLNALSIRPVRCASWIQL